MSVEPTFREAVRRVAKVGIAAGLAGSVSAFGAVGVAGAVSVGVGVIGLSGCSAEAHHGGGQRPDPPVERFAAEPGEAVRRAADVLARSGSSMARTSMVMERDSNQVTIRGHGRFDYVRRRGWLTVTLPGTVRTVQGPITEVVVPGALYMRNRGPEVPAGTWVRVNTASLADGNLVTGGATDPVMAAALLRGARDVTLVGTELIRGVKVTHFRGTADMARAAKLTAGAHSRALRAATRSFSETKVPFDAYLDERGRLRKVRHEFRFFSPGAVRKELRRVTVVSTTELYDFSPKGIDIAVPVDADIYDGKIVSPAAPGADG